MVEANEMLNDIQCSREYVRFLHKRNSCDCLESAYNKLKTTTQVTNRCCHCNVVRPTKLIKNAQDATMQCIVLGSAKWLVIMITKNIAKLYRNI